MWFFPNFLQKKKKFIVWDEIEKYACKDVISIIKDYYDNIDEGIILINQLMEKSMILNSKTLCLEFDLNLHKFPKYNKVRIYRLHDRYNIVFDGYKIENRNYSYNINTKLITIAD